MFILVLTDSLTCPRLDHKDKLSLADTWPKQLQGRFPGVQVHQIPIAHATSADLLEQSRYWISTDPDIVIVQVGLNDCLPRALARWELEFLRHFIWIGRSVSPVIKACKPWLRKFRNVSYVKERSFRSNLESLKNQFLEVCFVGIAASPCEGLPHGSSARSAIKRYNLIAKETFGEKFIGLDALQENDFFSDGYHLNKSGQMGVLWTLCTPELLELCETKV